MQCDILDSSEDTQMAAAIAASLREATHNIDDEEDEDSSSNGSNFVDASSDSRESPIVVDAIEKTENVVKLKDTNDSSGEIQTSSALDSGIDARPSKRNGQADSVVCNGSSSPTKRKLVKIFPKRSPSSGAFDKSRDQRSRFVPVRCQEAGNGETHQAGTSNGIQQSSSTAKCRLMLRLPDGSREKLVLQEDDTIKV